MRYVGEIVQGFVTLLQGMGVTLKNLFRKPVTEQYPHEKPELAPAFRSAIRLIRFEETNTHDCIACMQCVKICPSYCIHIDGTRYEGVKGKRAEKFDVDYALCSVCGLCLDVCPTDTLGYSRIYDVAGFQRDGFTFDLLEEFREDEAKHIARLQEKAKIEAAEKAAKAEAAKKAKAAAEQAESETSGPTATATKNEGSTTTDDPKGEGGA